MKSLVSIQRNYNITNWDREIKKGWKNTNSKKKLWIKNWMRC